MQEFDVKLEAMRKKFENQLRASREYNLITEARGTTSIPYRFRFIQAIVL